MKNLFFVCYGFHVCTLIVTLMWQNDEEQDSDRKEHIVGEPLRVKQKRKNYFIDSKRVGKKKISFQDQVALKV